MWSLVKRASCLLVWIFVASCAASTSACTPTKQASSPQWNVTQPVLATAPAGIGDGYLGAPLDAHFHPLQGPTAGSLFPAPQVSRFPVNQISHDVTVVADTYSLDANLSAWQLFDVSGGLQNDRRYASYRAFQIEHVSVVDDRTAMRTPPPGAVFYPWKIYYGHAFEAVFSGTSQALHAGIAAEFRAFGGDLQTFANTHSLAMRVFGLGLTPRSGQAIFARTQNEILSAYTTMGPAVPIFVEYRLIPGIPAPPKGSIAWSAPLQVEVVYDSIDVFQDGTWFATPWDVTAGCTVNELPALLTNNQALPPRTSVEDGHSYPMHWHGFFTATDRDRVACGLEGRFSDTVKSGVVARGWMPQPIQLHGPGESRGTFEGKNADTHYRVHYRIVLRQ